MEMKERVKLARQFLARYGYDQETKQDAALVYSDSEGHYNEIYNEIKEDQAP